MPEDYQAILSDLGVDTSIDPASQDSNNNTVTTSTDNAEAQATGTEADTTNAETDANADAGNQDDGEAALRAQRINDAFAAMRSENTKYKKFMQQIMRGANFNGSEEDFMKNLTEASYQRQAQRQGSQVSPEVLKRMDEIENQNKALIDAQNRQMFAANLKGLQDTFKLTDKEITEFVNFAVKEQIDLTIPGTNFVTLYQGLFFDKLMNKKVEEERQKWIAQNSKANSAANPDGKSGKKDPEPTNVNTMAEFESLLQSVPNNKK